MAAVAASETAMAAVAASETAMTAIAASETAMTAIAASETAMAAVAKSAIALKAVCSSAIAAEAVKTPIQDYYADIKGTCSAAVDLFTSEENTLGDGAGSWDVGLNSNNIIIITSCNDDGDTSYTAFYGTDRGKQIFQMSKHSGTTPVTSGVSMRGLYVTGAGSSVGNVGYTIFTAK